MKSAGPAVTALLNTDRSDREIAEALGVHRSTVNRHRRAHAITPQQVMERLSAEAVPVRPAPPIRQPWSPEEQARHRAELLAALTDAA